MASAASPPVADKSQDTEKAAAETLRRLYVFNGGFLTQGRIRRILTLAGYDITLGKPSQDDLVGVWGQSPTSPHGDAVAGWTGANVLRVEDAFLRSVLPGRMGEPPIGLSLDRSGVHFDPATRSDLEQILTDNPLDDAVVLTRARDGIERMKRLHLSKYSGFDPAIPAPDPGYVLVIDQTKGDASVKASRADSNSFKEMLFLAQEENPGARIIIKTHPESRNGLREGYFSGIDGEGRIEVCDAPISPWALLDGAVAVYTVSSQLGFEAILAGHKPVVLGQPFYMGWGLTDDRQPLDRRQRNLTRAQLFAAAMILFPIWYDPYRDRLCSFETALDTMEALTRAWRDDHRGWTAAGMSRWKRPHLRAMFGAAKGITFRRAPAKDDTPFMAWAGRMDGAAQTANAVRVEDGFLRSRGLGARLVPPLSLVLDRQGIYYDPTGPSDLEDLINASEGLSQADRARAGKLIARLARHRISKYNTGAGAIPQGLPAGRRILVVGQVEDDASVRLGAGDIRTNEALLAKARAANPAAVILYKPHPDVLAGLRKGTVADPMALADVVLDDVSAADAIDIADDVWTITSTLGFEALLRGRRVTCLGQPFYAGWGLTDDRARPIPRRQARPDIIALAHAALIAYPRYLDPVTGLACPVEVALERLETDALPAMPFRTRIASEIQDLMALLGLRR
jgi:capsular polysaccharide export protein